jgi:hypothetical protein
MRTEMLHLHLQSDEIRWHGPLTPKPRTVSVTYRVVTWLVWLVVSFNAFGAIYTAKARTAAGFDFTREGLLFLWMMVFVGWLGTKDPRVLETAVFVLLTVTVILLA